MTQHEHSVRNQRVARLCKKRSSKRPISIGQFSAKRTNTRVSFSLSLSLWARAAAYWRCCRVFIARCCSCSHCCTASARLCVEQHRRHQACRQRRPICRAQVDVGARMLNQVRNRHQLTTEASGDLVCSNWRARSASQCGSKRACRHVAPMPRQQRMHGESKHLNPIPFHRKSDAVSRQKLTFSS